MATPIVATPEKAPIVHKSDVKHKTGDHLLEYPLIKDCHDAVILSTLGRPAKDAVSHVYTKTKNIQPFKFFYDHTDKSCDSCLDRMDAWAPSLKTMECHDLTDPIVRPIEATHLAFVTSVVQPVLQKTNDVRLAVNSYLEDKDKKSFVASVALSVLKPCTTVLNSVNTKVKQIHNSKSNKTAEFSRVGKKFLNLLKTKKKTGAGAGAPAGPVPQEQVEPNGEQEGAKAAEATEAGASHVAETATI